MAYAILDTSAIHGIPGVVARHLCRDQSPQPAVDIDGQPVHDPEAVPDEAKSVSQRSATGWNPPNSAVSVRTWAAGRPPQNGGIDPVPAFGEVAWRVVDVIERHEHLPDLRLPQLNLPEQQPSH